MKLCVLLPLWQKKIVMKKIFFFIVLATSMQLNVSAQFIESGEIEFEVKTNIKKTMGSSSWAEMMKDKLPNFKTNYYTYSFSQNKSLYKFDHWENKDALPEMFRKSDESSTWFFDFNTGKMTMQKEVFGSAFNIKDSIRNVRWKLSNENRIIAGYNCRKATGIIMDSVYVFAFYTDEITIPGGPCSINGLPGMILGLTIPRLYSSWIATKVTLTKPTVTEPQASKNIFNLKSANETIIEKTKGWMGNDDDPESRKWLDQLIWNLML